MIRRVFTILIMILCTFGVGQAQNPWVHTFSPLRELYISPTGSGSGSVSDPMSFARAISEAQPGDLYWMLEGKYTSEEFALKKDATAERPIVFRARAGDRVTIDGRLSIYGDHTWIWGVEVSDPDGGGVGIPSAIGLYGAGIHLINNVVHDIFSSNCIGAWNTGSGQVVYGNITYGCGGGSNHPHGIYTQNHFATNSWKYIVHNILLDSSDTCGNCFNMHAYTEGGYLSGFHMEKNIVRKGRFLVGGYNEPAHTNVLRENYFFRSGPQIGYRRPTQFDVVNNYIVRGSLQTEWFWGQGEAQYTQTRPNVYSGNEVYLTSTHVRFRTSAYLSDGAGGFARSEGGPSIRPTDVFDNNSYSAPFRASFFANNNNAGSVDFTQWKAVSTAAGKAFDGNSQEIPVPTQPKIVLLPNEYDVGRAHLLVYNFDDRAHVEVDLSSLVRAGAWFALRNPKAIYDQPILSGSYQGPVRIASLGQEFLVFVVVWSTDSIPSAPENLRLGSSS